MAPRRGIEMLLSMSLVVALLGATLAQSESSCTNVLLSLSPCLDYITGNASTPSSVCCSQLGFVVRTQPLCLCEVVNSGASSIAASLNINQTKALLLPSACNVQTPPISTCSGSASSSSGVSVSNIPNSPSGIGSNTYSSTTGGSRSVGGSYHENSSSTTLPCSLLLLFLFATTLTFSFKTAT
ncbi:non-specific lipid-transfer protein-like protein At2g13820 [Abrus precatorius]|uniref:Non-specific lipid-transfer protein-like protein At2g13820 n=1 Tax=Abrus precatorius TaxID=3816 RepID=A0A8B8L9U9_ABRPR|nr:non-specific lipid-transfer protein-like protein At2g13820 [Abrus precatorius]